MFWFSIKTIATSVSLFVLTFAVGFLHICIFYLKKIRNGGQIITRIFLSDMDSEDNQVHPNFQDYNQHPNAPSYNQAPSSQSMQRYDQVPQQQQQSSTTVVIAQPQQHGNPLLLVDRHGIRDWSTGIFDCCSDVGNCM